LELFGGSSSVSDEEISKHARSFSKKDRRTRPSTRQAEELDFAKVTGRGLCFGDWSASRAAGTGQEKFRPFLGEHYSARAVECHTEDTRSEHCVRRASLLGGDSETEALRCHHPYDSRSVGTRCLSKGHVNGSRGNILTHVAFPCRPKLDGPDRGSVLKAVPAQFSGPVINVVMRTGTRELACY